MCCVLENNQTEEGVKIPKALQPFMGGREFIPYDKKKVAEFMERKSKEEAKKGGDKKGPAKKDGAGAAEAK
jgi:seryl-tRNA synthetase